jgi:HAD superfamily hydrolase (TIGR01490 family)
MRKVHTPWRAEAPSPSEASVAAAFYDMDGTLVSTNLVHSYLFLAKNEPTLSRSLRESLRGLLKLPAFLLAEQISRAYFNELLYAGYAGAFEDRLLELAEEHFEEVLKPNIFPGVYELVESGRKKGLRQVIVSGSLDVLVAPMARHLGMDDFICNRLEMKDGVATGKLVKPVVAGAVKARMLQEYARAFGVDLLESYGFSDSYSDYAMLAVVGRPAAVNPDRRLRRAATELEWPILDIR